MASPPAVPKAVSRSRTDWRLVLALAAIVALILVGLGAFDQVLTSIAVYLHLPGSDLATITTGPLPRADWTRILLNLGLVLLFLFLVPVRLKESWQAHGTYVGFMVSLFAEMYGFPLTIYFLASLGYASEPAFVRYLFLYGQVIGSPIVIVGIILIYKGWKEVAFKRGTVLVTEGIYRIVRHPQYLGFLLVTLGELIVWPTIPTVLLWPVLAFLYYRQGKREEAVLSEKFGEQFTEYAKKTPRFLPKIPLSRIRNRFRPRGGERRPS